jgi:spore coat protein U-like protein
MQRADRLSCLAGNSRGGLAQLTMMAALSMSHVAVAHAAMNCSIVRTSGVAFGSYDANRTNPLDSDGLIAFRCTSVGAADMLTIQLGRGDSNSFLPRKMRLGNGRLEYNLYLDASRTIVWGDGTMGTAVYAVHPPDGQPVSVPIFGRVPPRQNVRAGAYGDSIIVTVLY